MKTVEVKEQVRPPLRRCIELVLSGVKYRIFRAAITVAIIALAVAFLMTMLGESLMTRSVAGAIEAEMQPRRLLQFWVSRLSAPPDSQGLTKLLADTAPGSSLAEELAQWGKLGPEQMQKLSEIAGKQQAYSAFFSGLLEHKRSELVGRRRGEEIFVGFVRPEPSQPQGVRLAEDELQAFEARLAELPEKADFPTSMEDFKSFLRDWWSTKDERAAIIEGHRRAIANLRERGPLRGLGPTEFLAAADAQAVNALAAEGFRMPAEDLEKVRREAGFTVDARRIEDMLASALLKADIAQKRREKVTEVNPQMLFEELDSPKGARWLVALTDKARGAKLQVFTLEKLQQAAGLALLQLKGQKPEKPADSSLVQYAESVAALADSPLIVEELTKHKPQAQEELAKCKNDEERKLTEKRLLLEAIKETSEDDNKPKGAEWLSKLLNRITPLGPLGLSPERVQEVAKWRLAKSRLEETGASVSQVATKGGLMGFSSRTIWLLVVSFLVCVVGVANAMLMSVTERFREIATMKCLGATDGFVMTNFVLESVLQGVAGGVIGMVLGFLLGVIRSWWKYGWMAVEQLPVAEILVAAGVALVLGVVISALAALYPAWVAARLAPMEAMRIE